MKKTLIAMAAAAVIAAGSYFSGAVTTAGDALEIAMNKDKAKAACARLIDGEVSAPVAE